MFFLLFCFVLVLFCFVLFCFIFYFCFLFVLFCFGFFQEQSDVTVDVDEVSAIAGRQNIGHVFRNVTKGVSVRVIDPQKLTRVCTVSFKITMFRYLAYYIVL